MRKKDKNFWESAELNGISYRLYFDRLCELSLSMFNWQGLPSTVDPRYLELILFTNGGAVFFQDEVLGYLGLKYVPQGSLNVYDIPSKRRAVANGYKSEILTETDSVIIYNNMLHTPSVSVCDYYAKRLWYLDRTIDVNAHAQKTPVLICCDENERLSLENAYQKYSGNQPVIFASKALKNADLDVLSTGAPFIAPEVYELKAKLWNEALTYLGISNLSITKKERTIVDEINQSIGGTIASRNSRLAMRQLACEQINRIFGLDVSCSYRDVEDGAPTTEEV